VYPRFANEGTFEVIMTKNKMRLIEFNNGGRMPIYTLEEYNTLIQELNENISWANIRMIQFNLNPFLLNIYKTLTVGRNKDRFSLEFCRYLYRKLTPMYYNIAMLDRSNTSITKIDENTMRPDNNHSLIMNFSVTVDDRVVNFISGEMPNTVVSTITGQEISGMFIDLTDDEPIRKRAIWNSQVYPLLKTINTSLIKFLLQKSELYQSLDSLSQTMDFRGIFVDEELIDRLEKRGRLEEFNTSELSKDALNKVSQVMYQKLLKESGLTISPETRRAIPGDLPRDLVARLKREMDEGADVLS
jgi:hypothetical protein